LIEFGKLIVKTAIAGEAFSLAMKNLFSSEQWAIALLAGGALIAAGSAVRSFASKKAGGGGDNNSPRVANPMFGGITKFASGGIVSGPTNALIGEYPGARSNPEVVAPLDKLTGIIAGSIGGGDMGGTLSTRISGNDLVILLDRASKNRKNYF
jgi:hypothetical protein